MMHFLDLKQGQQKELIVEAGRQLTIPALIIEKDLWVCWILEQLFTLPEHMVFKGGTSLSKAFQLIDRFSEDLDVTVDYRNFHDEIDFANISKSQLKKLSEQLKTELKKYIETSALPHLQNCISKKLHSKKFELKLSEDGEQLHFYYPSMLAASQQYLRDHVLIEFGMRNSIEPYAKQQISPYLKEITIAHNLMIDLPSPMIDTLSPARTFWEKATLIHVECHRERFSQSPERLSRHWYDLYQLINHQIGQEAQHDIELLKNVITFKKAFFNASYANYDACLNRDFRLVPTSENLKNLENDFEKMIDAGMFYKTLPNFFDIIQTLKKLQIFLNEKFD